MNPNINTANANLPAGFRQGNASVPSVAPRAAAPRAVAAPQNLQNVPPELVENIRSQIIADMNLPVQDVSTDDSFSIFGFLSIPKKYVYILLLILLIILGYYLWRWFTRPSKKNRKNQNVADTDSIEEEDQEEEEEEEDQDEDQEEDQEEDQDQNQELNKKQMQQLLMQQQLMQQQMMQRRAQQNEKNNSDD